MRVMSVAALVCVWVSPALGQFASQGMELMSHIDLAGFGVPTGNGNSCWGWVSPGGREYAIMGLNNRVAFVDITDPRNPVIRATVAHTNSLWCDVKTHGNYCYTSNEAGGGIQVIEIAALDSGIATLIRNVTTNNLSNAHSLAVDNVSGFLYTCGSTSMTGSAGGPVAFSLVDPSNPVLAGMWGVRYSHEAQVVTYTTGPYAGRQVCFAFNEGTGMAVIDVTNKAAMQTMSVTPYPGVQYCHQGWLSPDSRYVYINDELDGPGQGVPPGLTRILDVTNLSAPFLAGTFTSNTPNSTDHNLYVVGNRLFEANYHSGLRVFDRTNPLAPVEIAYFDTYPEDDNAGFDGLWNNYPFLPSGNIILSDIDRGLFIVRMLDNFLAFNLPAALPTQLAVNTPTPVVIDIRAIGSPLDTSSVRLRARVGASGAYGSIPMSEGPAGRFTGSLPGAGCLENVSFYFEASSQAGTLYTHPSTGAAGAWSAEARPPQVTIRLDDMETVNGWTGGQPGDTATTGIWERGDPDATAAQPGDDHTPPPGVNCWVTGRARGAGDGSFDVDGGFTTLLSPAYSITTADTRIGYWRWYSNSAGGAPNADTFRVHLTSNNGSTWVPVEVVGPTGPQVAGGWFFHDFAVVDFAAIPASVRLRFIAEDAGTGSLIEACVDDLSLFRFDCPTPTCDPDVNQDGNVDQDDVSYLINVVGGGPNPTGIDPDFNMDGNVDQDDVAALIDVIAGAPCP
jgi:choice-of-anchor B domain-containing protein